MWLKPERTWREKISEFLILSHLSRERNTSTRISVVCTGLAEHPVTSPDSAYYSRKRYHGWEGPSVETTGRHVQVPLLLSTSVRLYCLAHFIESAGHSGVHKTVFCQFGKKTKISPSCTRLEDYTGRLMMSPVSLSFSSLTLHLLLLWIKGCTPRCFDYQWTLRAAWSFDKKNS